MACSMTYETISYSVPHRRLRNVGVVGYGTGEEQHHEEQGRASQVTSSEVCCADKVILSRAKEIDFVDVDWEGMRRDYGMVLLGFDDRRRTRMEQD
ncbi:hypothetical protein MLD38_031579 [Melastoma candidum]|uniref:Uncharacterized protein n=1 Tax=Melastoma candidum TaxID=119954 RepID=A0ACB9MRC4_9MYRT|nr:hypothetical protein MLD38_031579 [Melastoma candidum]